VISSALRTRRGASAAVLSMIGTRNFQVIMSVALALEYEDVLKREPETISMTLQEVDEFVSYVCANSLRREVPTGVMPMVSDPKDEFLARLAIASAADHLVTHNIRHLGPLRAAGISVVTPRELLAIIRGGP
jgi:predicted nucleic acid-binding protein